MAFARPLTTVVPYIIRREIVIVTGSDPFLQKIAYSSCPALQLSGRGRHQRSCSRWRSLPSEWPGPP